MKQILLFAALVCCCAATASADLVFSTSSTDPNAGSSLNLQPGGSGSMYVWVSTAPGAIINGINFNVLSSDPSVLQATAHIVANPDNLRWNGVNPGSLGDLVLDTRAVGLFAPFGLGTNGLNDFKLFSEIQFNATGLGTTNLTFTEGPLSVTYRGGSSTIWNTWQKGTGSVSVGSAIPEPSSCAVLIGAATLAALRRRRV